MNTCKEYSELCGNITVVTTSSSGNINGNDVNLSSQTQVRPLIYPSELQRLNKPGDIGHSIIVTFGNYPLKTYFSPSFKVPFYVTGRMDTSGLEDRYFDENAILYDIRERNKLVFEKNNNTSTNGKTVGTKKPEKVEVPEETETENKVEEESKNLYFERIERLYKEFAIENPHATYEDFIKHLSKTISKGGPE